MGILVHDNPPGTPISKVEAYAISHGWYQGISNRGIDDNIPQLNVVIEGSRVPGIYIQDTFFITFKIDNSQHVMSVSVKNNTREN